jgi:hypothetical protein
MAIIHNLLIEANTIIICSGSLVAGDRNSVLEFRANYTKERAMRTTGQGIFLLINVYLLHCITDTIRNYKREHPDRPVHPTLYILLAVWPLLLVRGIYGVLSAVVTDFNYFAPSNYGPHGLTDSFVISEYVLGASMEWTSCDHQQNDKKLLPFWACLPVPQAEKLNINVSMVDSKGM